jgi:hypothetical protein
VGTLALELLANSGELRAREKQERQRLTSALRRWTTTMITTLDLRRYVLHWETERIHSFLASLLATWLKKCTQWSNLTHHLMLRMTKKMTTVDGWLTQNLIWADPHYLAEIPEIDKKLLQVVLM